MPDSVNPADPADPAGFLGPKGPNLENHHFLGKTGPVSVLVL